MTVPTPPPIFDAAELRAKAANAALAMVDAEDWFTETRAREAFYEGCDADAAFVAAMSPPVVLALLDERATLLARVEAVRVAVERAKHDWNEGIGPIGALVNLIEELEKI